MLEVMAVFQADDWEIQILMWFLSPNTCGNASFAHALNVPSSVS